MSAEADRAEARRRTRSLQILLMCMSVVFTNVAAWVSRELVKELSRDAGLYLPAVHAHPLVFDGGVLGYHWCDLCGSRILRDGAWRCGGRRAGGAVDSSTSVGRRHAWLAVGRLRRSSTCLSDTHRHATA